MKAILSHIRTAHTVEVVFDNDGKLEQRIYPKSITDAEIKADIYGEAIPSEPPQKQENNKTAAPVKTIPEPIVVDKHRPSRQQMIDALEFAGVTDYDPTSRESLTAAFEALKKGTKSVR
jgi:hypothetical protein